jgi:hypothetical protein
MGLLGSSVKRQLADRDTATAVKCVKVFFMKPSRCHYNPCINIKT